MPVPRPVRRTANKSLPSTPAPAIDTPLQKFHRNLVPMPFSLPASSIRRISVPADRSPSSRCSPFSHFSQLCSFSTLPSSALQIGQHPTHSSSFSSNLYTLLIPVVFFDCCTHICNCFSTFSSSLSSSSSSSLLPSPPSAALLTP